MPRRLFKRISNSIEDATISQLLSGFVSTVFGCAVLYCILGRWKSGIIPTAAGGQSATFLDCLYFSCVTVSSLGYGDFRPIGLSRLVAVFEVLGGLGMITILIARFASDRQSRLIQLTYEAEQLRRLNELADQMDCLTGSLADFSPSEKKKSKTSLLRVRKHVQRIRNYCDFQIRETGLSSSSSAGPLLSIVRHFTKLLNVRGGLANYAQTNFNKNEIRRTLKMIARIVELLKSANAIRGLKPSLDKLITLLKLQTDRLREMPRNNGPISKELLETIREQLPAEPWPKGIHRTVAEDLSISNSSAHAALHQIQESLQNANTNDESQKHKGD